MMDFEQMLFAQVSKTRQEELVAKSQKTLGEVILLLKIQPVSNIVKLDFTKENPCGLCSYRGYYEDLSLDYDDTGKIMSVKQLLGLFKVADGRTYTGYKGGNFTMDRRTLVWVAPWGSSGRMLTDIKSDRGVTTICTQNEDE